MELAGSVVPPSGSYLLELLRFPHRRFAIDSQLPLDGARARIRGIIQPSSLAIAGFFPSDKLFVGEFSPERFKVLRILPYNTGSTPIVEGSFAPTPIGTRVSITMRLKRNAEVGSFVWFGIATLMLAWCVLGPFWSPHIGNSAGFALFMLMMIAGGYAMLAIAFNLEVGKTQTLLREALQAQPSARIQEAMSETAARRMPRFKRSARAFAIVLPAVGVLIFLIFPALQSHSEKFRIARHYVEADPAIRSEIGSVTSVEPDRWRSDQENYVGTQEGNASFSIEVKGTSGSGVVSVRMQKHLGIWKVMSAELHESKGRTIALGASGN
jgi:cytochrome oxidase complex assembly protein 1